MKAPESHLASAEGSLRQPARRDALSLAKDLSSIAQSIAAVLALTAGAIWFLTEKPYAPVARGSVKVEHRVGSNHFFDIHAEFENSGKVPLSFDCFVIHVYAEGQTTHLRPLVRPYCKGAVEQLSSGQVITFERSILETEVALFSPAMAFEVELADQAPDGKWLRKATASDSLLVDEK